MKGRKRHGRRRANRGTRPWCFRDGSNYGEPVNATYAKMWRRVDYAFATRAGRQLLARQRYDREIAHARARGLTLTAERIEAERDDFVARGQ